jgi:hypothetical protein
MGVRYCLRYLRFCQPFCDGFENIVIRSPAIIKAGGINKDNITTTAVRMRTADGLNVLGARFQVMTDCSGRLSRRYIDELLRGSLV